MASLHLDASRAALADANLKMSDVDGLLCAYSTTEPHMMLASVVAEHLGIRPAYASSTSMGGATAAILVMTAAVLVQQNVCRNVLVVTGDNRLSGMGRGAQTMLAGGTHPEFEQPYGLSVPAAYALIASRYMHEYGLTEEHLASVAVTQRTYAASHPLAHFREPLTLEQATSARYVSTPLRLYDCCPVSDGAAAVVVSSAPVARDRDGPVLRVLGYGQGHTHEHLICAPSLTDFGCAAAARTAFSMAGVKPSEIDVAQIYDSFTITLLVELESMGFFQRGEAGPAALAGELGPGGRLPCNTHGGLLSYGHSGAAGGMFHFVEAVRQLRGQAGSAQVEGARTAFVHGDGGILSAHCSVVLVGEGS
jgi:acetyl-CoA acetyltransferase